MKFGKLCYYSCTRSSDVCIIEMEVFNALNSGALNKICRTCLSENINMQSIFESSLNEMVMACATVQVTNSIEYMQL